ncbi:DUF2057 domain-containing protein [Vibrio sp. SS-MA-C1-2]|uniref:DUF2057 family protein n=1 Tax=Vibrio sp. SS-MA-C1-2 TaxID=2908646 RepID=UPI001F19996E|nr:DUF2057 family protein [Vibrio sp. SS-MA-C1-2]UJF19214.1 DUF2057 domain-containing protein [Vibrio sp. SS-MA-C1-2]
MFKKIILPLLIMLPVSTMAAEIILPNSVNLMALDGKKLKDKDQLADLAAGSHQLIIEYSQPLKRGSAKSSYTSDPLIWNIDVNEGSYKLSHKYFANYTVAAGAFSGNKVGWAVSHNDGEKMPLELPVLPSKGGFMAYNDLEELITKYNQKHGLMLVEPQAIDTSAVTTAAVTTTAAITATTATAKSTAAKKIVPPNTDKNALKQLQAWYLKATPEQRKEFRRWQIDQD